MNDEWFTKKKYMLASDTLCTVSLNEITCTDEETMFISSHTKEIPDLDDVDKVQFTPKITTGVDSSMERDVYLVYEGSTIASDTMYQQMARCRSPLSVNYCFTKNQKRGFDETFDAYEAQQKEVNSETLTQFRTYGTPEMRNLYLYIFTFYSYNQACMKTNPKLHFEKLLDEQGLHRIPRSHGETSPSKYSSKEAKALRLNKLKEYLSLQREADSFAKEHSKNNARWRAMNEHIAKQYDTEKNMVSAVNDLLKLPFSKIEEHADLFISSKQLHLHFNMSRFLFNTEDELFHEIDAKDEFKYVKIQSDANKIRLFKKLQKEFGIEESMLDPTIPMHHEQLWSELSHAWTWRSNKTCDFSTTEGVKSVMKSFGTELFGREFYKVHQTERIKNSKGKRKDTRKKHYEYNEEYVHATKHLRSYRKTKVRNVSMFVEDSDGFSQQTSQWSRDLDRIVEVHADNEDSATDCEE